MDPPNGSFRSLFYKGDGVDIHRTPSAWFLPVSNRLALRATTESQDDMGSDTLLTLPMQTWFHLTFVFENKTEGS
jgi:SEL1 protein